MDAARVRELTGMVHVAGVLDAGDILGGVEPIDGPAGNRGERPGALGRLVERRGKRLALPALLVGVRHRFHIT